MDAVAKVDFIRPSLHRLWSIPKKKCSVMSYDVKSLVKTEGSDHSIRVKVSWSLNPTKSFKSPPCNDSLFVGALQSTSTSSPCRQAKVEEEQSIDEERQPQWLVSTWSSLWMVDWNMNFMFPYNDWECHHPNWLIYFFRGVGMTNSYFSEG